MSGENFKDKQEEFEKLTDDNAKENSNGAANGDHVIKVEDVKIKTDQPEPFRGLGREEVLKQSAEPCWVRLRFAVLILFWIVWLAMFVGAILIVAFSGDCKPKLNLAKSGAAYILDPIKGGTNFSDLTVQLENLKNIGVKNIILSPFLSSSTDKSVAFGFPKSLGSDNEFKSFMTAASSKGLRVTVELDVNSISKDNEVFTKRVKSAGTFNSVECTDPLKTSANWFADAEENICYLLDDDNSVQLNLADKKALDLVRGFLGKFLESYNIDGVLIRDINELVEEMKDDGSYEYTEEVTATFLSAIKSVLAVRSADTVLMIQVAQSAQSAPYDNHTDVFVQSLLGNSKGADLNLVPVYSIDPPVSESLLESFAKSSSAWQSDAVPSTILSFLIGFAPRMPVFASDGSDDAIINGTLQIRDENPAFYDPEAKFEVLNFDMGGLVAYEVTHGKWDDFIVAANFGTALLSLPDAVLLKSYYKRCEVTEGDGFSDISNTTALAEDFQIEGKSAVLLQKIA